MCWICSQLSSDLSQLRHLRLCMDLGSAWGGLQGGLCSAALHMWAIQSAHVRQYMNAWVTCLGFALSFVKNQLCDRLRAPVQAWLHTLPHRALGPQTLSKRRIGPLACFKFLATHPSIRSPRLTLAVPHWQGELAGGTSLLHQQFHKLNPKHVSRQPRTTSQHSTLGSWHVWLSMHEPNGEACVACCFALPFTASVSFMVVLR